MTHEAMDISVSELVDETYTGTTNRKELTIVYAKSRICKLLWSVSKCWIKLQFLGVKLLQKRYNKKQNSCIYFLDWLRCLEWTTFLY